MLQSWILKEIDHAIFSQLSRYTTKHNNEHHVAILFKNRRIVSIGQNRLSQKMIRGGRRIHTTHAEKDLIHSIRDMRDIRGSILVIIRIGAQGIIHSAPCPSCMCLIQKCMKEYGLRRCLHS
jgi:hypothetical protein